MAHNAASLLAPWSNFYVMVGGSAGALTGLMFVVITLVNRYEENSRSEDGIATFSTPTVLHFCAALLVAAILTAPWHSLLPPSVALAAGAFYGVVYIIRISLRTRRLINYVPDLEDWMWYSGVPLLAYGAIVVGAVGLRVVPAHALFAIAAGAVLLIFLGIRNAWDVVTFLAVRSAAPPK